MLSDELAKAIGAPPHVSDTFKDEILFNYGYLEGNVKLTTKTPKYLICDQLASHQSFLDGKSKPILASLDHKQNHPIFLQLEEKNRLTLSILDEDGKQVTPQNVHIILLNKP